MDMDLKEAYLYLKRYQKWRIGEDDRTMEEADLHPKDITIAVDIAIRVVETKLLEQGKL